jgi:hypothetical protein
MQLPRFKPASTARRMADIWTVRLLSSITMPGHTAFMISLFVTSWPGRSRKKQQKIGGAQS